MSQLLTGFILDEDEDVEMRHWVFDRFGDAAKAAYTMFEATFSTAWFQSSRRLIEDVSDFYAIFWVVFVVTVNFTVIRVVSALFLKTTMAVAAADSEKMIMSRMKSRQKVAEGIRQIFREADTSGDGSIDAQEFVEMLAKPSVGAIFKELELEVEEVVTLFIIVADEDGEADYEEFLEGALKMKESIRTIDTIQILHQHMKLGRQMDMVLETLGVVHEHTKHHLYMRGPHPGHRTEEETVHLSVC